jgi:hypothetical protein
MAVMKAVKEKWEPRARVWKRLQEMKMEDTLSAENIRAAGAFAWRMSRETGEKFAESLRLMEQACARESSAREQGAAEFTHTEQDNEAIQFVAQIAARAQAEQIQKEELGADFVEEPSEAEELKHARAWARVKLIAASLGQELDAAKYPVVTEREKILAEELVHEEMKQYGCEDLPVGASTAQYAERLKSLAAAEEAAQSAKALQVYLAADPQERLEYLDQKPVKDDPQDIYYYISLNDSDPDHFKLCDFLDDHHRLEFFRRSQLTAEQRAILDADWERKQQAEA